MSDPTRRTFLQTMAAVIASPALPVLTANPCPIDGPCVPVPVQPRGRLVLISYAPGCLYRFARKYDWGLDYYCTIFTAEDIMFGGTRAKEALEECGYQDSDGDFRRITPIPWSAYVAPVHAENDSADPVVGLPVGQLHTPPG